MIQLYWDIRTQVIAEFKWTQLGFLSPFVHLSMDIFTTSCHTEDPCIRESFHPLMPVSIHLSSLHRPSTHPCILKSTTAPFNRYLKLLNHICIDLSILLSVFRPPIFDHILFLIHSLIIYPYLQSFFLLSMVSLIKLTIYLSFTFPKKIYAWTILT